MNNKILLALLEAPAFSYASRCIKWKLNKRIQIKVTHEL